MFIYLLLQKKNTEMHSPLQPLHIYQHLLKSCCFLLNKMRELYRLIVSTVKMRTLAAKYATPIGHRQVS